MRSYKCYFPIIVATLFIIISMGSAVMPENHSQQIASRETEFINVPPQSAFHISYPMRPEYLDSFERSVIDPWTTSGYPWGIRDTTNTYGPQTSIWGYRYAGVPDTDIALYTGNQTGYLVTPVYDLTGWSALYISADYWSSFEGPATNFDGGIVEISNDGGATWVQVDSLAEGHLNPTYDAQLAGSGSLGTRWAYCYSTDPDWVNVSSQDLMSLGYCSAGDQVQIRLTFASDPLSNGQGWFFDNSRIADTPPPDLQPPIIAHSPLPDTIDTLSNYTVTATITDDGSGVNPDSVILHYDIENGPTVDVTMTAMGADVYESDIPAQTWHTDIWYKIMAADNAGNWAETDVYNFEVTSARTIIYDDGQPYWVPGATLPGDGSYVQFHFADVGIDSGLVHQVKMFLSDPGTFDLRIYQGAVGAPSVLLDSIAGLVCPYQQWYTVDVTFMNIITDDPNGVVVGHIIGPGDSIGILRDPVLDYPANSWNYVSGVWNPGVSGDNMIRLKVIPVDLIGVDEKPGEPYAGFALSQITPNPMTTHTTVNYQLATSQKVSLKVYDIAGQLVRTLVSGHEQAGSHEVIWDSRDTRGSQVASGVYFVKLEAGDNTVTKKILIIK
jgi:hypothetical protein